MNVSVIGLERLGLVSVTMADINYFLELSPECVKFILNLLGFEEVGRAACVCREFYKELSPRAKPIAHTIQCIEKKTKKKWGHPALTSLTELILTWNQITNDSDETVVLLKSRGCYVQLFRGIISINLRHL
eukprot:SAG22_NODE_965_length_6268_cov_30.435403_4_plen_131_part_00